MSEAKIIMGDGAKAKTALWRLTQKGSLLRVKEGLYAAIPPGAYPPNYEIDRYLVVDHLLPGAGVLAYHTALEIHGVAYSSFSTLYYLSGCKAKPFEFQEVLYRPVWTKDLFGAEKVFRGSVTVSVTDKERTFLDCIRRPDLCGGLEEVMKSLESLRMINEKSMLVYLRRFGESSLYRRAGFMLSLLEGSIRFDETLLASIREHIGVGTSYLIPGGARTGGRLNHDWRVYVPTNLEELLKHV